MIRTSSPRELVRQARRRRTKAPDGSTGHPALARRDNLGPYSVDAA